jgi:hypothetical protein
MMNLVLDSDSFFTVNDCFTAGIYQAQRAKTDHFQPIGC